MEPREKKANRCGLSDARLSKQDIRSSFKRTRSSKPAGLLAGLSLQVAERIAASAAFAGSSKVALYSPTHGEVDVSRLFSVLRSSGKRAFFPKVCGEVLRFFEVSDLKQLLPGGFSIPEPPENTELEAPADELDLILVPGICFDIYGSRIGSGRGFYDRAAADLSPGKLCAAAYSFQFVRFEIPTEPHDRRVGFVATERGVFRAQIKKDGRKDD